MQYMLIQYTPDNELAGSSEDGTTPNEAGWMAYTKALIDAGVMVSGNGLHGPSKATTVRVADGKRQIVDGPYADTKEQLGGYYIIDVPDLDAAITFAEMSPAVINGSVEIRPIYTQ